MPKQGAASGDLRPCNCKNAELHSSLEQRAKYDYINHDLSDRNVVWHRYDERPLTEIFDACCDEYTKATKQKPQLETVRRYDRKTKTYKDIVGFAPVREMVITIKEDTSEKLIDSLMKDFQERYGMTPLAFSVHKDEGRWINDVDKKTGEVKKKWKPNYHAHLFFDVMERRSVDHKGKEIPEKKRGRTIKFTDRDTSNFQDMIAKVLGMERGQKREEGSHRENANVLQYKVNEKVKEYADWTQKTNSKQKSYNDLVERYSDVVARKKDQEFILSQLEEKTREKEDYLKLIDEKATAKEAFISRFGSKADKELMAEKKAHQETKNKVREERELRNKAENRENIERTKWVQASQAMNAMQESRKDDLKTIEQQAERIKDYQELIEDAHSLKLNHEQITDLANGKKIPFQRKDFRHPDYPDTPIEMESERWLRFGHGIEIHDGGMWKRVKTWLAEVAVDIKNWFRMQRDQERNQSRSRGRGW